MIEKLLMKGNEAMAEAAIRCGCRYYFGYPITPQNELIEYMSKHLEKRGGKFIQAESELAAVNMAYGASAAGGRVLLSSSSPGIALMQESFSFMCSVELPVVIINVSRGGPGIGTIQPGQADYYQATRGGGNGDYHIIVYAPSTIQEAVEIVSKAFDTSDKLKNPVMILVDGVLGQMMEPVVLPEAAEILRDDPRVLTGHKNERPRNVFRSVFLDPDELEGRVNSYWGKYETAKSEYAEFETCGLSGAELVFVAYGSTARIVKDAIEMLSSEGIKTGLIRPVTLWPYPVKAFDEIDKTTKYLVSAELSKGQMMDDVLIASNGRWPVSLISRIGGVLLSPEEVVRRTKEILRGE